MKPVEKVFEVNGYQLAAKQWHGNSTNPVIALHGWLDNAASFDILAPLMPHCHIVALDLPGHGLSDHKSQQATYNIWDDLLDILAIADQLGWQQFTLLGHSRGGIMSVLLAASAPQRIRSLVLLDGIWAHTVNPEDAARQLCQYINDNRALANKKVPVYSSVEQAIAVRCKAAAMSRESAKPIVERGLKPVDEGVTWRTDPKLLTASAFKMTEQHNRTLMEAVQVPVLLLLAEDGFGKCQQMLESVVPFSNIDCRVLPGSHHFHLEDTSQQIASHIQDFFYSSDTNPH